MTECIAVSNQKGGVGKSTTANAIGAGLFRRGKRVLYIDLDAQGNLSYSLGVGNDVSLSCFDVLTGKAALEEAVVHTPQGDLLPFSPALSKIDSVLTEIGKEYRLRDQLQAGQEGPGGEGNLSNNEVRGSSSEESASAASGKQLHARIASGRNPSDDKRRGSNPAGRANTGSSVTLASAAKLLGGASRSCPPGGGEGLSSSFPEESLSGAKSLRPASGWDYVIIDTPPALGTLTINALVACNSVIIPSQADIYSLQGVGQLIQTIQTVQKYCNNNLFIRGFLLVRYSPRAVISRDMTDLLEDTARQLNTKLYRTKIRECVAIKEAQAKHQDIFSYSPKSNAAEDYGDLINEIFGGE